MNIGLGLRKEDDILKYSVLGLGYAPSEYDVERTEWMKHGIAFDFAGSLDDAAEKLRQQTYICIAIRSDQISQADIAALRAIRPIPTVILPPSYSAAEAHICAHLSAIQYMRATGLDDVAALGGDKSLQVALDMPSEQREALTIITVKELSFCLEYRSVEVRGVEVELTEKEFDILALLLTNPKKVFTHETIMDAVWHEDVSFYSPKAVTTHISNLRRKLKTAPDVPEYIKSVRGGGYKFDVPK